MWAFGAPKPRKTRLQIIQAERDPICTSGGGNAKDMSKFAVLIPYFNPAEYRSHTRKLAQCLDSFRRGGLADDVYLTGSGTQQPSDVSIVFWDDDCSFMWHKERLVNLGVHRLPSQYTHVVWADSDIIVNTEWAPAVAAVFQEAEVAQCFRTAHYRATDDRYSCSRPSALRGGGDAAIGLVWDACRSLFTKGPGLFELGLVGGGDSVLGMAASLPVPWLTDARIEMRDCWSAALNARLDAWLEEMRRWLVGARLAAANVDIEVLEHGPPHERRYVERNRLLTSLVPEEHLLAEKERVFRWTQSGIASIEAGIRAYFYGRREDDPSIAQTNLVP
jgi:hypothetical protein